MSQKGSGSSSLMRVGQMFSLHLSKAQESNLTTLETGAAIQYSLGRRHGKAYAENLSVIVLKEEKAKSTPRSADGGPTDADPDDAFEKEWGLRRF